jgi:hypothetical protein
MAEAPRIALPEEAQEEVITLLRELTPTMAEQLADIHRQVVKLVHKLTDVVLAKVEDNPRLIPWQTELRVIFPILFLIIIHLSLKEVYSKGDSLQTLLEEQLQALTSNYSESSSGEGSKGSEEPEEDSEGGA